MRIRFRVVKDIAAPVLDTLFRVLSVFPFCLTRGLVWCFGLLGKAYYFLPGSHVRRVSRDVCVLTGRSDPRALWGGVVDRLLVAALGFCRLMREGGDAVAAMTEFEGQSLARCRRAHEQYAGAIGLVPHNAGAVLGGARFSREFSSVMLVRESKSPRRGRILAKYIGRLGPELVFVRRTDPKSVARAIIDALRKGRLIMGTTDLARRQEDTVEVAIFGQRVWMPAWPARFAKRRSVPIIPCYIRIVGPRIVLWCGDAYLVNDVIEGTQQWATALEKNVLEHPEDWPFMYDKRWARVLAAAAAQRRGMT